MRTLVTGGVRSGKSSYAEALHTGPTTYLATGPTSDDADWQRRIERHRADRPKDWSTVETTDVAAALTNITGPVLVDDLGNWIRAALDDLDAWERDDWQPALTTRVDALTRAVDDYPDDLTIVTNEVGWSVTPVHRSARLFQDELGRLNQRIAGVCDRVVLVVSGLPLALKGSDPTT